MRLADFVAPNDTKGWALWLAERGLHVFRVDHPDNDRCCQHGEGCERRGKHPFGRWSLHGTTDLAVINRKDWFGGDRDWNIGIDCDKSGLLVVDEDNINGLVKYATDHGHEIPPTLVIRTRQGRKHYYFRQPGGYGNRPGALKDYGCDVRGKGGYVVGPGSKHQTGKVYAPESLHPIADMPDWLAEALRKPEKTEAAPSTADPLRGSTWATTALDAECTALARVGAGQHRNEALNAAAFKVGQLVPHLLTEADAEHALMNACAINGYIDKDGEAQARETLRSGLESGMREPRQGPADEPEDLAFDRQVAKEVQTLKAREAARREFLGDERPAIPAFRDLTQFLAEPDEAEDYRVEDLWPAGGNILLAAQAKSGKTTMRDNLIRSLVDGDRFLGRFAVKPLAGRVAVLDFEMPERTARRWFRDQGIRGLDKVVFVGLRGKEAAFDVLDQRTLHQWAAQFEAANVEVLIVDCLGPLLASLGMDENDQLGVGRVLSGLRQVAAEAGIAEILLVHHMGHNGERSRGASRLRDWPDAEWRLLNVDEDDRSSAKFFAAFGRDVFQQENELEFSESDRHLSLSDEGRSRKEARGRTPRGEATLEAKIELVAGYLKTHPGASGNEIEKNVIGKAATLRTALKAGVERSRFRPVGDGYELAEQGVLDGV